MQLINSNAFEQIQTYRSTEHLVHVYFRFNRVVVYYYSDDLVVGIKMFSFQEGELSKVTSKELHRATAMLRNYKVIFLHTVYPYLEESTTIVRLTNNRPTFSNTLETVIRDDKGVRYLQKSSRNAMMLKIRYEPAPALTGPFRRRLFCTDNTIHTSYYPTAFLHRCYIRNCPCKNIGLIGHCMGCGRTIHECIYPGCTWTMTNETVFHTNIYQYKHFCKVLSYMKLHFRQQHQGELISPRDDIIRPYETDENLDFLNDIPSRFLKQKVKKSCLC